MNVICYTRVNLRRRADKSKSLKYQERILRKYCEKHNYNIIDFYTDNCSAKTFARPGWKRLTGYVKKNKGKVDLILCRRWDRFTYEINGALTTIQDLNKLGVQVNTIEQQLDFTRPDNKRLLINYLSICSNESSKRSHISRMREEEKSFWNLLF